MIRVWIAFICLRIRDQSAGFVNLGGSKGAINFCNQINCCWLSRKHSTAWLTTNKVSHIDNLFEMYNRVCKYLHARIAV
jgi:hypothetical protein